MTVASAADLDRARRLGEVIYRLAHAALHRSLADSADVEAINAWAAMPCLAPQLDRRLQRA